MKRENREGPSVMGERAPLLELDTADVVSDLTAETVTFVDTRSNTKIHGGTVARSVNIPTGKSTASFGVWVVNPETDQNPLVLLAPARPPRSRRGTICSESELTRLPVTSRA